MWGMAPATAEGPITHRTMVTTPNSSTKVRRNSRALCQMTVRGEIGFPAPGRGPADRWPFRARLDTSGCPVTGRPAVQEI